jgi:hypothetical protein
MDGDMLESMLFVLTGNRVAQAIILFVTIAGWWWVCEYFVLGIFSWWPRWMDFVGFILVSVGVTLILACVNRWCLSRSLANLRSEFKVVIGVRPRACSDIRGDEKLAASSNEHEDDRVELTVSETLPHVVQSDNRFSRETWQRMAQTMAEDRAMRSSRRFLVWLSRQVKVFDSDVDSALVRRWWVTPKAIRTVWLRSAWVLVLWGALIWVPARTRAMDAIALNTGTSALRVYDVVADGMDPGNHRVVQRLTRDSVTGTWFRSAAMAQSVYRGTISLRTTAFPHAYHHVQAVCVGEPPGCQIAPNENGTQARTLKLPVRAGKVELYYFQTMGPDSRLNLRIRLLDANDVVLDEAWIEPQ